MIKNVKKLLTLAIVIAGCTATVNAQTATATATATVSANIITPITIAKVADMSFGNLVANSSGGTVVLSTGGVVTSTSIQIPAVTGTVTAAQFTIGGQDGYAYTLTLPSTYEIKTGDGGATETMELSTFTSTATNILTGGTETVKIGATLTLVANQSAGSYTGATAMQVGVNYN